MAAAAPSPPVACSVGRAACSLNYDVFFTSPLSVISCSIAHIISATKTHCQPYIRLFLELYQSRQMQSRTCSQPKYFYCIQKLECSYKEYDCSVSYYLHVKSDFLCQKKLKTRPYFFVFIDHMIVCEDTHSSLIISHRKSNALVS